MPEEHHERWDAYLSRGEQQSSLTNPVNNLSLSNSLLNFDTIGLTTTNAVVGNLFTDPASTTNNIAVNFLPGITSYPATFHLIIYTNLTVGVGTIPTPNIGFSNLPVAFTGF